MFHITEDNLIFNLDHMWHNFHYKIKHNHTKKTFRRPSHCLWYLYRACWDILLILTRPSL